MQKGINFPTSFGKCAVEWVSWAGKQDKTTNEPQYKTNDIDVFALIYLSF